MGYFDARLMTGTATGQVCARANHRSRAKQADRSLQERPERPGSRVEKALRESEERYRELFENANDIVFTIDLEGNFTSLNKTGERITGYNRK